MWVKIVKSFAATAGVNYLRIKLLKKDLIGTITGSAGGTVSLNDGSSITLPAVGVVKESDNSSYSGIVNVYAAVIDPTASDFSEILPGSLMANNNSGQRVMLRSYGMLAVALESPSAESLQIASGKKRLSTLIFLLIYKIRRRPASRFGILTAMGCGRSREELTGREIFIAVK